MFPARELLGNIQSSHRFQLCEEDSFAHLRTKRKQLSDRTLAIRLVRVRRCEVRRYTQGYGRLRDLSFSVLGIQVGACISHATALK